MSTKIVTVIGLGFVGLPTACVLANIKKKKKSIFSVHGIDKDINGIKNNPRGMIISCTSDRFQTINLIVNAQ